jgi:hypothetical protein
MAWFPKAVKHLKGVAMKPCMRSGALVLVVAAVIGLVAGASILHSQTQAEPPPEQEVVFSDGFETGDTSAWSEPSLECMSIFAPPTDVTE